MEISFLKAMGQFTDNINEKLKAYFESIGLTKYAVAQKTGISEATIGRYFNNASTPTVNKLKILIATFPELENYLAKRGKTKPETKHIEKKIKQSGGIPLVEVDAVAGFGNSDFAVAEKDILDHYVIPDFERASFMIRVRGNSMEPKYSSGDIVACRVLRESQFIQWNEIHVIATKEQGILIKRIKEGDNGDIVAISDNKDYPPFTIPKGEITGIALVLGGVRLE